MNSWQGVALGALLTIVFGPTTVRSSSRLRAAAESEEQTIIKKGERVVCHALANGEAFEPIVVSDLVNGKVDKHILHGDKSPGDRVPNEPSCFFFDHQCQPVDMVGREVPSMTCAVFDENCEPYLLSGTAVDGEDCMFFDDRCNKVSGIGKQALNVDPFIVYDETCNPVPCYGLHVPGTVCSYYDEECNPKSRIGQPFPRLPDHVYDENCRPHKDGEKPLHLPPVDGDRLNEPPFIELDLDNQIAEAFSEEACKVTTCPCMDYDLFDITTDTLNPASCQGYTDFIWPDGAAIFEGTGGAYFEVYKNADESSGGTCIATKPFDFTTISMHDITPQEADVCIKIISSQCEVLGQPIRPECPCFGSVVLNKFITNENIDPPRSCQFSEFPIKDLAVWQRNPSHSSHWVTMGFSAHREREWEATCISGGDLVQVISDAEAASCIDLIVELCKNLGTLDAPC